MATKQFSLVISQKDGNEYCDAEQFRNFIQDVIFLVLDILRSQCDIDPEDIANRLYILQWILEECNVNQVNE